MGVLDAQGAALEDTVLPLLNAHGQRLDGLDDAVQLLQTQMLGVRAEILAHIAWHMTQRSLWTRLRWLLTGRLP